MGIGIGVSAGVISIILGLLGMVTSLVPPKSPRAKKLAVTLFGVLSAIAIATTVVDQTRSAKAAQLTKEQMEALLASSAKLSDQNHQLLLSNNDLQKNVLTAAEAPRQLALQQTLKTEIQEHLANISQFLAVQQEQFRRESAAIPASEYPGRYSQFRRNLASTYAREYFPRTQKLLQRAAGLGLISDRGYNIDGRFIEAGMLPYISDLEQLLEYLPD